MKTLKVSGYRINPTGHLELEVHRDGEYIDTIVTNCDVDTISLGVGDRFDRDTTTYLIEDEAT